MKALTGPENYTNTESIGRNYLLPVLEDRKLSELTLHDFQSLIYTARKKDGSELSKKTLSNIRGVIVNFSKYCEGRSDNAAPALTSQGSKERAEGRQRDTAAGTGKKAHERLQ